MSILTAEQAFEIDQTVEVCRNYTNKNRMFPSYTHGEKGLIIGHSRGMVLVQLFNKKYEKPYHYFPPELRLVKN